MDVVWSPRARRNRDAIHAAIARNDPARAHAIISEIVTAINRLAGFPALGRPGRKSGTRELVLARQPYIVVYRVRATNVQVLEILHTSRRRT